MFHFVTFSTGYNSNRENKYKGKCFHLPFLVIGNDNAHNKLFARLCEFTYITKIKSDDDASHPNLNQRVT